MTHIVLVNIFICDFTNGGEALKFFRFVVFESRGIENDPIASVHPFQWRGFAMIGLDKTAHQSTLKMVF